MRIVTPLLLLAALAGCERPPPAAFETAEVAGAHAIDLGTNAAGETCSQQEGPGARAASILCGTWTEPAAHVAGGSALPAGGLEALATSSGWREGLNARSACDGPPQPATVLGQPALRLACHLRLGGWPYVGLATAIDGRGWTADGVAPAEGPMARAIGVLSGRVAPRAAATADAGLAAQRVASAAFSASDMAQFRHWLDLARAANNAGNFADAERADAAIASLQRRVLGPHDPALARTLTDQAVQVSDLGRYGDAGRLLDGAEQLARDPAQRDPNAMARVLQARGLDLLNQHKYTEALAMLRRAETAFAANAPPSMESGARQDALSELSLPDESKHAAFGVVETRRAQVVALRHLGRYPESQALAASAIAVATQYRLADGGINDARLLRTAAFVSEAVGAHDDARQKLTDATADFDRALPGTLTYAQTALLLAAREAAAGSDRAGLAHCRAGIASLRAATQFVDAASLLPCLALLDRAGADRTELFEAAQLAQGTTTSREVAQAVSRLQVSAQNPRVGQLLREKADLEADLARLSQRKLQSSLPDPALDAAIAKTRAAQTANSLALQAASPTYRTLVQQLTPARDVMAALKPNEAMLTMVLGPDQGWAFLVRPGEITAAPVPGGASRMATLVQQVRASLDTEREPPPPFDTAAAAALYQALLHPFEAKLAGAGRLIVAPYGPLLSLPFGVLLTAEASPDALAAAPWLIRRYAVMHVPSPANFVALRTQAGRSPAPDPWFGFGDVRAPRLAQASASFPPISCGGAAKLLAGLPPLPGADLELNAVRRITGGNPSDALLGEAFTREAVLRADLGRARILHFATHALLPTDLPCVSEPALVVTTPATAKDASPAFLTAGDIASLKLNADLAILSACSTGGAQDGAGGESLSGLARSFFSAGTRALLVTHWAVNDRTTAHLVALMALQLNEEGPAAALAAAQQQMLAEAKGDLALAAHPFYWAPLAVIGADTGGTGPKAVASLR